MGEGVTRGGGDGEMGGEKRMGGQGAGGTRLPP